MCYYITLSQYKSTKTRRKSDFSSYKKLKIIISINLTMSGSRIRIHIEILGRIRIKQMLDPKHCWRPMYILSSYWVDSFWSTLRDEYFKWYWFLKAYSNVKRLKKGHFRSKIIFWLCRINGICLERFSLHFKFSSLQL